jgi:hypothetical protein
MERTVALAPESPMFPLRDSVPYVCIVISPIRDIHAGYILDWYILIIVFKNTNYYCENNPFKFRNPVSYFTLFFPTTCSKVPSVHAFVVERSVRDRLRISYVCQASTGITLRAGRPQNQGFILDRNRHFCFRYRLQAGFESHPAMCIRRSFLGDKVDWARSLPFISS